MRISDRNLSQGFCRKQLKPGNKKQKKKQVLCYTQGLVDGQLQYYEAICIHRRGEDGEDD